MDQMTRILKQLAGGIPYKYESELDATPMGILCNWANTTDMKQISLGMLRDWFSELEELENDMLAYYKNNKQKKKDE